MRSIYCNILKFQDKPILRACQTSALQHSLFWRYVNFHKIMRTIHTSMTSTFYFEFITSFERKTLTILRLKCTSHGYMYWILYIVFPLSLVFFFFDMLQYFEKTLPLVESL